MALTVLIHGEPHEYPITDWAELSRQFGPQEAKYRKEKLQSNPEANKVHCQECGKVCTKARGYFVLTRSTIVCGKCYDESKHGASSVREQRGPARDPATCPHERQDRLYKARAPLGSKRRYCLDCWAEL